MANIDEYPEMSTDDLRAEIKSMREQRGVLDKKISRAASIIYGRDAAMQIREADAVIKRALQTRKG